jgi:hypothetical protein
LLRRFAGGFSAKRIKGLCGAKPPQKPGWTNAGFVRRLALWKFYEGRALAGLIIAAQPGGGEWQDRSIAVVGGAFDAIGGIMWSAVGAAGCVGDKGSS